MLPSLDPPLTRGARALWMNPDRPFDDEEIDRLGADPDDGGRQERFARHVLDRDPENIWAIMVLAERAETMVERIVLVREAVRVGLRLWGPSLAGRAPEPDWTDDRVARLFTGAVLAYGVALMEAGHRAEAAGCLAFLLEVDPGDAIGAVEAFSEVGLVVGGDRRVRSRTG